ncbi:MAG: ribosome maturation factor RimM [Bacteroidales bacterium]|nr:ribosome maturation factor RimM [Bacteroidales bacterium]
MITSASLTLVGKINKTHGVGGELSVSFYTDAVMDTVDAGSCLILDIDGIYTPFFVGSARPRSSEALLLKLDLIDSQEAAAQYVGKNVYMLTADLPEAEEDDDEDGLYAGQLIGYQAVDNDGKQIGEIVDIDDATENVLFVLTTPEGETAYIPVADEFIAELDQDNKVITFDLPEGLI